MKRDRHSQIVRGQMRRSPRYRRAFSRTLEQIDRALLVREMREAADLSQKELAERVGTTQSVIAERHRVVQTETPQGVGGSTNNGLYGGIVKLRVVAEGDPQDLPALIAELRRKPQLRVLEVVSASLRDADILMTLGEPLPLVNMLGEINGVSRVSPVEVRDDGDGPGERPPLDLQLTKLLLHPDEPFLQLG